MVPIGITVELCRSPIVPITDAVAVPSRKTVIKTLLFLAACPRSSIAIAPFSTSETVREGSRFQTWTLRPCPSNRVAIAVPRRPVPRTATEVMGSGDQILLNLNVVEQTLPSTASFSGFQAICGFAG